MELVTSKDCRSDASTIFVTRQTERPGHQQRLIQKFTEDVFIFSLLAYHHSTSALELFERALYTGKFTYLLTYLA